jgi:hypothetical protein
MTSLLRKFYREVKSFLLQNWWVFLIYLALMIMLYLDGDNHLLPVYIATSLHFIADVFIMMMVTSYANQNYREGTYFQLIAFLIFLSAKVYTGLNSNNWHYVLADPIYALAAYKNYKKDVLHQALKFVNGTYMLLLSLIIISIVLFIFRDKLNITLIKSPAAWVQTSGIFLFAIALTITTNQSLRHQVSLLALSAMVIGSAWLTHNSWVSASIDGLAISYTLLPLVVLIIYLKNSPAILQRRRIIKSYQATPAIEVKHA